MAGYDHQEIEKKAQQKWEELEIARSNLDGKDPYYLLVEFPYPSGDLHIGHWYAFAVTDIFARYKRMTGTNLFFPIGFDAFGLPAENAAIRNGEDPKKWTYANMERMRTQLRSMGASFDWSREVATCDPGYYQWTQWLFTKLFEHGLAYRAEASVKWCPKDQTVLANEQVIDGCCERCGTPVEERRLTQWFLKITDYADRLLKDLEPLPWREEIKEAQRAWIGKSEGANLQFSISGGDEKITVFTTRPDTIYGATYVVLAPEHPLVSKLLSTVSNKSEIEKYIAQTRMKTERERSENKEKTGVKLENVSAINPATKEQIPIFTADYVLGSYGTGAVMAVPAHDERDYEFAQKMKLPIKSVIKAAEKLFTGHGELVESESFSGRHSQEAMWDIVSSVGGERTTQYRLRDWGVSRQRYWGCPTPIVYDPEGKPHAVPKEHLPWLLPTDVDFTPTGKASPLASSKELNERVEKIFGKGWTPEYDTLDTFVDSSWYFFRYLASDDSHDFTDQALAKKWLPVNRYSGGSEHTTMHLLYARFFVKALYDLALSPVSEPFDERFNRGIILGPDGQKMSKSKGNVLNPDDFVSKYGADAVRIYLAFIGPYNEAGSYPWNLDGVASMRRFLERVGRLVEKAKEVELSDELARSLAKTAKKVAEDSERFKFNTAIAALMSLLNELEGRERAPREAVQQFVVMLSPFAPHIAEYFFEILGGHGSAAQSSWPVIDESLLAETIVDVVVQVNGKRRGSLEVSPDAPEGDVLSAALKLPPVIAALGGASHKRVVYVPGKILNIVV